MPDPLYSGRYTQACLIVPSDTVQIQGPIQGDGKPLTSIKGFHALTSGAVTAKFADGRNMPAVTFPVVAGVVYPYALTYVYSTTVASLMALN